MIDELPYAPQRKRPLSLWRPLDYLVLLYWVFFFPQAIRWYLERFGRFVADERWPDPIWRSPVYRNLVVQDVIIVTLLFIVYWFVASRNFQFVEVRAGFGLFVMSGLVIWATHMGIIVDSRAAEPAERFSLYVIGTAVVGVTVFWMLFVWSGPRLGLWSSVLVGVSLGIWTNDLFGRFDTDDSLLTQFRVLILGSLLYGSFGGLSCWLAAGSPDGAWSYVLAGCIAVAAASLRVEICVLALLPAWLQRSKRLAVMIQRVSPLPILGLTARLLVRLEQNWEDGISECQGLLSYTQQFISVKRALKQALAFSDTRLLPRVARWCDRGSADLNAVRRRSAALDAETRIAPPLLIWIMSRPLSERLDLHFDTPGQAACVGFLRLYQSKPELARNAFTQVRGLPFGAELYASTAALAIAFDYRSFDQIGEWLPPTLPDDYDPLRPEVVRMLLCLGEVSRAAQLVVDSRSPRDRSAALNRVVGGLQDLWERLEDCPQPERIVVENVVWQWRELTLGVATAVGTMDAREPVACPYIVGAPVPADRLVGRESVYDQLRSAWVKPGQRDSLVVYGHRRMGKTSVMKNLLEFCRLGADTGLAFLNLQTVDWSEPLPDLCQAIAFELWRSAGTDRPAPQSAAFASSPLPALRGFLAGLNTASQQRRFILVLDEYELLDEHLPAEAGTRFVELLRGLTQQYPWLVIALVGLHSLKERSASFYQAIFAWRPVRIGFLDAGGVADCLEVQDDDFPLAYDLEAVAEVYRLTGGQPFLVQLLGDGLVQGFNRRLREEIRPPASRFTAADVAALTATGELFTQGAAYFLGIWGQAGAGPPGQQAVLRALAPYPDGLDAARLAGASGQGEPDLAAVLKALADHDVLAHRDGRWGYTVELMRLWVTAGQMDTEPGGLPA